MEENKSTETADGFDRTLAKANSGDIEAIEKIAYTYYKASEHNKAVYWKEKAYAYYRNNYGEYATQTLKELYNLGRYYRKANRYDYALNVYHVLYNACVKNYGKVHHGTLLSLNVLVNCCLDLGFNKTVYKLYKKAYEDCLKILGEEHLDTIQALENYAYGCYYVGDYKKALSLTKKLSAFEGREEDSLKLFACTYIKSGEFEKADKIIAELESKYKPKEQESSRQDEKVELINTIKEDQWFFNESEVLFYLTFLAIIYKNDGDRKETNQPEENVIDIIDDDLIYYILVETGSLLSKITQEINEKKYTHIVKIKELIVFVEKVAYIASRYKPVKKGTIRTGMALFIIRIMKLIEALNSCDYQFDINKDVFLKREEQNGTNKLLNLAYNIATQFYDVNRQTFTKEDILLFKK